MTRINCVPVRELTDKHLGAEYRELPRVFKLAEAAYRRGDDWRSYPQEYVLGPGHVKFFYPRLRYLQSRFIAIVEECHRRGRKAFYTDTPTVSVSSAWWQDWEPTPEALALNRARIAERLGAKP